MHNKQTDKVNDRLNNECNCILQEQLPLYRKLSLLNGVSSEQRHDVLRASNFPSSPLFPTVSRKHNFACERGCCSPESINYKIGKSWMKIEETALFSSSFFPAGCCSVSSLTLTPGMCLVFGQRICDTQSTSEAKSGAV